MKLKLHNWNTTIFNGFYGSLLDVAELECSQNNCLEENEKPLEIECGKTYKKFISEVADNHVTNILDFLIERNIIKNIEYKSLYSPKYYNFETDRIEMLFDFNCKELEKYCFQENKSKFCEYLKENFTSYDGFISFVPNNFEDIKIEKKSNKSRYYQVLIEFYLMNELDFDEIHLQTYDDMNELFWNYATEVKND